MNVVENSKEILTRSIQYSPVEAYWEVALSDTATCYNEGYVNLTSAIVNTVLELWITLLPIPIVMGLNMPLRQRLQVVGLLSLGIVVTITGVLRVYYIWRAFRHTYDVTWYTHQLWICAVVEVDLAVVSPGSYIPRGLRISFLMSSSRCIRISRAKSS